MVPSYDEVKRDNAKTFASIAEEQAFERKAEKMLRGHRQAPNGRNVFAFVMRYLENDTYKAKFDNTFPDSPGSKQKLDSRYCPKCDKLKVWCECKS
jgi:hypothetical protein